MFYSMQGHILDINSFVKEYEPHYYVSSNSKIPRNKTSHYVEDHIEDILYGGLYKEDIVTIIAWKIGAIDHKSSIDRIFYRNDFDKTLQFKSQFGILDVNDLVCYIEKNFEMFKEFARMNPSLLYKDLFNHRVKGFAAAYILTLVYFFTGGVHSIFDKYADIALEAYINDIIPNDNLKYEPIESSDLKKSWNRYMEFCKKLIDVVGYDRYRKRNIYRALWVYGHYFKT